MPCAGGGGCPEARRNRVIILQNGAEENKNAEAVENIDKKEKKPRARGRGWLVFFVLLISLIGGGGGVAYYKMDSLSAFARATAARRRRVPESPGFPGPSFFSSRNWRGSPLGGVLGVGRSRISGRAGEKVVDFRTSFSTRRGRSPIPGRRVSRSREPRRFRDARATPAASAAKPTQNTVRQPRLYRDVRNLLLWRLMEPPRPPPMSHAKGTIDAAR